MNLGDVRVVIGAADYIKNELARAGQAAAGAELVLQGLSGTSRHSCFSLVIRAFDPRA